MPVTEKRPGKPDPRRERLEAELRENLKRRKEQARARGKQQQAATDAEADTVATSNEDV